MTEMSKTKKRCPNGHEMDPAWEVCPYCPSDREPRSELARTVKMEEAPTPARPQAAARRTVMVDPSPEIGGMAWLVGMGSGNRGRIHIVDDERTLVGAAAGCQVVIEDPHVSDRQASIRFSDGSFTVTDLDSTNGTFVNEERVQQQALSDGDRVRFGTTDWVFKCVVFEHA